MIFSVNFTSNITINYSLIDDPIVDIWKKQIVKYTIDDCDKINHYTGYSSQKEIEEKIDRLYWLANTINLYVDNKIDIVPITKDNYRQALSVMHIHFPELYSDSSFSHLYKFLSEYNDIIHWLEGVMHVLFAVNPENYSSFFAINLDFNKHSDVLFFEIPKDSLKLFNPYFNFGELHLAYAHVGRHAQEIYSSKDLVCPKEQFVPQTKFTASTMMYFTDYFHNTLESRQQFISDWQKFYDERGGIDFWGYDINDPNLAFGALKIGNIESIIINGIETSIPKTHSELNEFRKLLASQKIISWIIE